MSPQLMVDLEQLRASAQRFARELTNFERGLRALAAYYPAKPAPQSRNKREGRYLDRIKGTK